ncbi:hypothetical protein GGI07_005651 [Coemansia sp. Benny D115]|nr:hypothetical protein GGI07_005651 [Coemansia sp. Benny D115]
MHSLFRRSQALRTNSTRRHLTWEDRARAALAAAREVEEASGESVPTRPSEVNVSRRLCYGPRYILPGTHPDNGPKPPVHQHEVPCDVQQSAMALDLTSLQMSSLVVDSPDSPDAVGPSPFYTLSFTVNSLVPLTVNLYWLASEEWTLQNNYPTFASRVGVSRSYDMPAGLTQRFSLPRPDWLEPSEEPYRTLMSSDWQARNVSVGGGGGGGGSTSAIVVPSSSDMHTCHRRACSSPDSAAIELDVLGPRPAANASAHEIQELGLPAVHKAPAYGLIIELVERNPASSTTCPQSQISFIDFYRDGGVLLTPRCVKQKLCLDGMLYVQHEIFGLREAVESHLNLRTEDSPQCAICLSDDRDTVLLPCRHMCMCRECANTYRQQSNKCPICRTVVETILHIQPADQDTLEM